MVKDELKRWLQWRAPGLTADTVERLHVMARRWTEAWGSKRVRDVTVDDVLEYVGRLAREFGPSLLNKERSYARQFFRYALEKGLRADDPTRLWKRRKEVVEQEYRVLSEDEEARLVEAAGPVLGRFVVLSTETGLRAGTLRQLQWEHVRGEVLEIPAAIMKARRPHRMLLSERAQGVIGEPGRGPVLPGLPDSSKLAKDVRRAAQRAGLEEPLPTPHDLRRTWVARLAAAGASELEVMSLGAWKSVPVILRHYFDGVRLERQKELLCR